MSADMDAFRAKIDEIQQQYTFGVRKPKLRETPKAGAFRSPAELAKPKRVVKRKRPLPGARLLNRQLAAEGLTVDAGNTRRRRLHGRNTS